MLDKIVKIKGSDGVILEVARGVLKQSEMINAILEGWESEGKDVSSDVIPVDQVSSEYIAHVISYCEQHKDDVVEEGEEDDITTWDVEFVDRFHNKTLFDLIMASHNLRVKKLLSICCQAVANLAAGKSTEEIRRIYGITNDFTPEEEEALRLENAWCDIDD